ncbi:RNI-like protein [Basidiobolus meristosporus CBS 931.73]|uniref:RNI-like protein n=1 Tax=Basidiobolus meristosporus CBS 931.73 TaxID=1314790 RepID=A0A1Y1Z7B2_9FUNG|nr:RNI-like protein [Basidiobolus meristosporus CBS 931.73]|eukprot:ORY05887.1 RNI-like protein [Basidiobolus meristosporus CBS 931.73]
MASAAWTTYASANSGAYVKIETQDALAKFAQDVQENEAFAQGLKGVDLSPLFLSVPTPEKEITEEDADVHVCGEDKPCLLTDAQFNAVVQKCSNLEVLCVGAGPNIIDAGTLLNLSDPLSSFRTYNGPSCLSEEALKGVSTLTKLQVLNLYGCDNLTHEIVAEIGRNCSDLKELCIDGEDEEDEDDYEDIEEGEEEAEAEAEAEEAEESRVWSVEDWKAFQNLETLSADTVDLELIADLPNLTRVQVAPFAESEVLAKFIDGHADKLRYLNVCEEYEYKDPENSEDESITHQKLPANIFKCQNLESFSFNVYDVTEVRAPGFLEKVISSFPQLKHLELAHSVDVAVNANLVATKLPQLESLIWDSEDITDEAVEAIVKGCTKLRNIHLPFATEVTDAGVISIAQNLKGLEQITVDTIKVAGFKALKENCPAIYELNVVDCNELTIDDIADIKEKLPKLESICIAGEISEEMLSSLSATVPEIQIHFGSIGDDEEDEE